MKEGMDRRMNGWIDEFLSTITGTSLRKEEKLLFWSLGTLGVGRWGWSWCPSPKLAQSSSLQAPPLFPCQAWGRWEAE